VPKVNLRFSRHVTVSSLAAALLGPTAVMGCASRSDTSPAPEAPLPEDTEDTTFTRSSPESAAKYGVAYWGSTPDGERNATTVVGYGANQERIVTLQYDIDHDVSLDLSAPGIDARVRVDVAADPGGAPQSPPSAVGDTDAAVQLYARIVEDVRRAADEEDEASTLSEVGPGLASTDELHPTGDLVSYSKALLNKCWTEILPCRRTTRLLVKNYQVQLLGCGPTNQSAVCKSVTNRPCWWTNSKGLLCSSDLSSKRKEITSARAECEATRTSCLKQGVSAPVPQCVPKPGATCA
jgi:hypothetical protein